MVNCRKMRDSNNAIVYQFMADNPTDVSKAAEIAKRIDRHYCEDGFIRILPVTQMFNNIPVFNAVVDADALPMNYDKESDLYVAVDFVESSNFIDLGKLEWVIH